MNGFMKQEQRVLREIRRETSQPAREAVRAVVGRGASNPRDEQRRQLQRLALAASLVDSDADEEVRVFLLMG